MPRTNLHIGRHGEYYVCALLEAVGVEATRSDGDFDVIGLLPSGKLVKIEVKTCSAPRRRDRSYGFGINKGSPDVYALYAFDLGIVVFEPAEKMRALTYVSRSRSHFTQEAQEASLKALLDF